MAKRKYSPDKNGIYSTLVWDGTYTPDGRKHRKQLRSKKSSADLERQVRQFQAQVEARKITQATDMTFCEYARIWADTYKPDGNLTHVRCTIISSMSTSPGLPASAWTLCPGSICSCSSMPPLPPWAKRST